MVLCQLYVLLGAMVLLVGEAPAQLPPDIEADRVTWWRPSATAGQEIMQQPKRRWTGFWRCRRRMIWRCPKRFGSSMPRWRIRQVATGPRWRPQRAI